MGFLPSGQPNRYYTLGVSRQRWSFHYGDLMPSFTSATTGGLAVSGYEANATLARRLRLSTFHGVSRVGVPMQGFMPPMLGQQATGHRIQLSPMPLADIGLSVLRVRDDVPTAGFQSGLPTFYRLAPKDNLLLGSDVTLPLPKRRGTLGFEYVASVFTSDRTAKSSSPPHGDSGSLEWLARRGSVARVMSINDSTRTGALLIGRLTLPVSRSSTTLEYRRTSRSFASLPSPFDPGDWERFRIANYLFIPDVTASLSGEYAHSNESGIDPITTRSANVAASATTGRLRFAAFTVGARLDDRWNDDSAPIAGQRDSRVHQTMRLINVSAARDAAVHGLPLRMTAIFTRSRYENRVGWVNGTRTSMAQVVAQTLPPCHFLGKLDVGLTRSRSDASWSNANVGTMQALQIQSEAGYVIRRGVEARASRAMAWEPTSGGAARSPSWGARLRWAPSDRKELGIEWQSSKVRDPFGAKQSTAWRTLDVCVRYRI